VKQSRKSILIVIAVVLAAVQFASIFLMHAWLYTTVQLAIARAKGIYATPEDGMRAKCARNPFAKVTKIEIERAGVAMHDGSRPHVWFVIAKVWQDKRSDGKPTHPRGYSNPGSYFVRVREGWVHVPEGSFPHLLGSYMQLFGLT
jgi:hypothetical protein